MRGPWELRITKFPSVAVKTRTGFERYNYFEIDGNKLMTGFHGTKESNESEIGEIMETTPGNYIIIPKADLQKGVRNEVLPVIIERLHERGKTVQVVDAANDTDEIAA
jgi:hypothetical protein